MQIEKDKSFKRIYYLSVCVREAAKLFKTKKENIQFKNWLYIKFSLMDTNSIEDLLQMPYFEKLTQTNCDIYSIRSTGISGNPRVLFTTIEQDDNTGFLILHIFKEKDDSDYLRAINIACKRF